jgi:uncharacterized membrane protein YeaQ/YmgE (transglycosylase-associated protein family)
MSFLWWMIIGLVVGAVARLLSPQKKAPWWFNLAVGPAVGLCSGLLYATVADIPIAGFDPFSIVAAGIGSIAVLWRKRPKDRACREIAGFRPLSHGQEGQLGFCLGNEIGALRVMVVRVGLGGFKGRFGSGAIFDEPRA